MALGLGGCSRDPAEREHRARAPLALAPAQSASVAPPREPLDWIERDSELIVGVNLEQLRTTALWRAQLEPWLTHQLPASLPAMRQRCAGDPLAAVRDVTIGLRNFKTTFKGSLVIRGVAAEELWRCLREVQPELRRDGFDPAWDGEVLSLQSALGNGVVLVGEDEEDDDGGGASGGERGARRGEGPHVIRGLLDVEATSADLKKSARRPPALRASAAFRQRYERLDGDASGWFLLQGPLLLPAIDYGVTLEAVSGTVSIDEPGAASGASSDAAGEGTGAPRLVIETYLHTTTAERARRYAATGAGRLRADLGATFTSFDISAEREDVRVRAVLTTAQLLALLARGDSLAAVLTATP